MKMPCPVLLGVNDVVTLKCGLGHPMMFVRSLGTGGGGQVVCTPLLADGVALCSVCLSDSDIMSLLQAGCIVELED